MKEASIVEEKGWYYLYIDDHFLGMIPEYSSIQRISKRVAEEAYAAGVQDTVDKMDNL
jgi:hypothetical protein